MTSRSGQLKFPAHLELVLKYGGFIRMQSDVVPSTRAIMPCRTLTGPTSHTRKRDSTFRRPTPLEMLFQQVYYHCS
jgi:hypothetical protein